MNDAVNNKNELIKNLATEISFRLLATSKHSDKEWLIEKLEEFVKNIEEGIKGTDSIDDVAVLGED
tara:strand:+ start:2312 stop:2509 length:198 start_codon:yes stop_codon:yes gene_type:complete